MAQETSGTGSKDDRDRKAAGTVLKGATSSTSSVGTAASAAVRDEEERRRRGAGGWLWRNGGTNFIGLLLIAGLGLVTTIAVSQKEFLPRLFGFDIPVEVKTVRWGNSIVFPLEGKDKAGKKATFDFVAKTKDYSWIRGQADQVTINGTPIGAADVSAQLFGPDVAKGLAPSSDLIAVGVASEEGTLAEENARAAQRGKVGAGWADQNVGGNKGLWVLNLGQFSNACVSSTVERDTSWERPFLIVGARDKEAGVNLGEALANAMNNKTNLPSTGCYSNFELAKLR
jgi:hypothetical protein